MSTKNISVASTSILAAKAAKGLTFVDLGKAIGRDETWTAAAIYGQAKFSEEELEKLCAALGIKNEYKPLASDAWWPDRGLGEMPPRDPVIYRLFEGVLVYGTAIKAIIHEKFGDGICSMIDAKVTVEKKEDPRGDRVLITFDGKFLPYIKW